MGELKEKRKSEEQATQTQTCRISEPAIHETSAVGVCADNPVSESRSQNGNIAPGLAEEADPKRSALDSSLDVAPTVQELLQIATCWQAYTGGYVFKAYQLERYDWLAPETFERCTARMLRSLKIGERPTHSNNNYNPSLCSQDQTDLHRDVLAELTKEERLANVHFEVQLLLGKIPGFPNRCLSGAMDCIDANLDLRRLYEFKCTKELETTHILQVVCYAYLLKQLRDGKADVKSSEDDWLAVKLGRPKSEQQEDWFSQDGADFLAGESHNVEEVDHSSVCIDGSSECPSADENHCEEGDPIVHAHVEDVDHTSVWIDGSSKCPIADKNRCEKGSPAIHAHVGKWDARCGKRANEQSDSESSDCQFISIQLPGDARPSGVAEQHELMSQIASPPKRRRLGPVDATKTRLTPQGQTCDHAQRNVLEQDAVPHANDEQDGVEPWTYYLYNIMTDELKAISCERLDAVMSIIFEAKFGPKRGCTDEDFLQANEAVKANYYEQ